MTCIGDAVTSFCDVIASNFFPKTALHVSLFLRMLSWWIFFVSNVFWVRESIPTSHKCVTFTDNLETQGHVMLYVTFTKFGCACPKTMDFFVSNVFWVRKFISTSHTCVTFTVYLENQGHVMFTWPLLTLAVLVQKRSIFCFWCFLGQGIHFN